MRPFILERPQSIPAAVRAAAGSHPEAPDHNSVHFLAGGTTLLDLMKLDVMRPEIVVDINGLADGPLGRIEAGGAGLRLGAMVRMADAARHPDIARNYPALVQSLALAASAQLRNMASLGGNLLQRTRCTYFRDVSYPCNKRDPGSGCAAIDGFNRMHAVLGASDDCIATYPGDFAQALIAYEASLDLVGPGGPRSVPIAALHRPPGDTPQIETTLREGEMIAAISVPAVPWFRRSLFLKIRDRESYEFALASAAVALDLDDGRVRDLRIALGGVATVPWRARRAEAELRGRALDEETASAAAQAEFAQARPYAHNGFKIELGRRTLVRALRQAAALQI
jgi:xanthine dehydrogenase YagS FAD-binding subunit